MTNDVVEKFQQFLLERHPKELYKAAETGKTLVVDWLDFTTMFNAYSDNTKDIVGMVDRAVCGIDLPGYVSIFLKNIRIDEIYTDPSSFFDEEHLTRFVPKKLGDYILRILKIKTIEGLGSMFIYDADKGYYVPQAEERIRELIAALLHESFSIHRLRETIEYIRTQTYISADHKEEGKINLANGVLDISTKKFEQHSPDYFHIKQIPIEYDPEAECRTWLSEINTKIPGHTRLLQQAFGYSFTTGQRYEKAFLFYGPMRTMKSTALYVLTQLLGEKNVESYSLQDLNEGSFTRAYLYGKSANIYADLSPKALEETTVFMLWTGQDSVTAAKKHQHPFTFRPDAKLFFSCNEIPPTSNKNLAYYRRWILVPFRIQHEKVDMAMHEKLDAELPGILNWALDGLVDLEKEQKFAYDLNEEQIKDLYERNSDTVMSFIRNCIDTEDDAGSEVKRVVRKAYERYCEKHGLRCMNHIAFGKQFRELTGCGTGKKMGLPAYHGVSMLGNEDKSLEDYGGEGG